MAYCQLTQEQRYRIATLLKENFSIRHIAARLDRSPSTISREIHRNATRHDGWYRAEKAHDYAVARRKKCRRGSQFSRQDFTVVEARLRRKWSPEQISTTLGDEGLLHISRQTIYRYIHKDRKAGGLLWCHTRLMRKRRRKRYKSPDSRGVLPGKRHISERPLCAHFRLRIGHWEGDTVMGKDMRHCLLTLVERKSGFAIIKKLSARNKDEVIKAATRAIRQHAKRFKTITFDNGTEFHGYATLEERFPIKCYFATPYHSWERGSNENLNGLIRQYLPKGMCMRHVTQRDCDYIANELNNRPRKRLGFKPPAHVYYAS